MPIISTRPSSIFFQGRVIPGSVSDHSTPGVVRAAIDLDSYDSLDRFLRSLGIPDETLIYKGQRKPIATLIDFILPSDNRILSDVIRKELVQLLRSKEQTVISSAAVILNPAATIGPEKEPALELLLQVHYPEFLLVTDSDIKVASNKGSSVKVNVGFHR